MIRLLILLPFLLSCNSPEPVVIVLPEVSWAISIIELQKKMPTLQIRKNPRPPLPFLTASKLVSILGNTGNLSFSFNKNGTLFNYHYLFFFNARSTIESLGKMESHLLHSFLKTIRLGILDEPQTLNRSGSKSWAWKTDDTYIIISLDHAPPHPVSLSVSFFEKEYFEKNN